MAAGSDVAKPTKAAHINMMTDTIIANMPLEGLQSTLRDLLGNNPALSSQLNALTLQYLEATRPLDNPKLFDQNPPSYPTPAFYEAQRRYRCYMGCGKGFEGAKGLQEVMNQVKMLHLSAIGLGESTTDVRILAFVDSDLVQVATAIQKELHFTTGQRSMTD